MWIFPAEGIMVGNLKLKFHPAEAAADSIGGSKIENVEAYLAQFDSTGSVTDSLMTDSTLIVKRKEGIASLQFKNGDSSPLYPFFEALDEAKANGTRAHIFHYGDSQIESDRMSNVVRQKLQEKFGGGGPGLVAPVPITASANIMQSQSDNWKRYTSYGFDNAKAGHNNYGVMCAFGRFTTARKMEDIVSTDSTEAWIELRPSSMSTSTCKSYTEAQLYFGNFLYGFQLTVFIDGEIVSTESIQPETGVLTRTWNFASSPKKLRFEFVGPDSPDVYGIELHNSGGVNVSNIALRGNDGGAFRRVNSSSMEPVLTQLNASLFILQFGGNAVPYLSSEAGALSYGENFKTYIRQFKKMSPNASIIVIGPSDMSTSIDGVFRTWPFLASLRDGMKNAALAEGCGFWDMYEVMGGENSMVSWVTNNPPYAGPDYTHFTPAGARKVAELLYKAISDEYDAWKHAEKVP
jgi:lysophospholipase L1-like esterase